MTSHQLSIVESFGKSVAQIFNYFQVQATVVELWMVGIWLLLEAVLLTTTKIPS